jgi:CheY-like chemotaxis protein
MSYSTASVLFVDSHPDTLAMLELLFSEYETESATCVSEAVYAASHKHHDLYLVESRLPDDSGITLCNRLKTIDPTGKIVFFSTAAYPADISRGFEAGAVDYIRKPNVDALVEAVSTVLAA